MKKRGEARVHKGEILIGAGAEGRVVEVEADAVDEVQHLMAGETAQKGVYLAQVLCCSEIPGSFASACPSVGSWRSASRSSERTMATWAESKLN